MNRLAKLLGELAATVLGRRSTAACVPAEKIDLAKEGCVGGVQRTGSKRGIVDPAIGVDPRAGSALLRGEADAQVGVVAEGLGARAATAAEAHPRRPIDGAPGPRADLETAGNLQRPIGLWRDLEPPVPNGEGLGSRRLGLPGRREADGLVRAVAERLVLRGAAAAERRPETDALAVDRQGPRKA